MTYVFKSYTLCPQFKYLPGKSWEFTFRDKKKTGQNCSNKSVAFCHWSNYCLGCPNQFNVWDKKCTTLSFDKPEADIAYSCGHQVSSMQGTISQNSEWKNTKCIYLTHPLTQTLLLTLNILKFPSGQEKKTPQKFYSLTLKTLILIFVEEGQQH